MGKKLFFILLIIFSSCNPPKKNMKEKGEKNASDIIAYDIYGTNFRLYDLNGKPKIIQFMRVYCNGRLSSYSIKQFEQLSKIYEKSKDSLYLITITISTCSSSDLKKICENFNIKWTFINDYSDYKLDIINSYAEYLKDMSEPALLFLNEKNEIIDKTNFCDDEILGNYIKKLLNK